MTFAVGFTEPFLQTLLGAVMVTIGLALTVTVCETGGDMQIPEEFLVTSVMV